jgi:hypothetical protein
MFTTARRWLSKLLPGAARSGRGGRKQTSPDSFRPSLDPLEDRVLCDTTPLAEQINPGLANHIANPGPDVILWTPVTGNDGSALVFHIHPYLTIKINGKPVVIPAGIGTLEPVSDMPLHTHDASTTQDRGSAGAPLPNPTGAAAVLHVESIVNHNFRLKDFFAIWGKTFTPTNILGHKTDAHHKIIMTVNGVRSKAFGNLVLTADQGFQTNAAGTVISNPLGIEIDYVTIPGGTHHAPKK